MRKTVVCAIIGKVLMYSHHFTHRHFWHSISLSEMGELYISIMLRQLALSLIGIFVPIYLWLEGFDLVSISLLFAGVFAGRIVVDPLSAWCIRKWSSHRLLLSSYVLLFLHMLSLLLVGQLPAALFFVGATLVLSSSAFYVPFHYEFSGLKHTEKEGSELSWLFSAQKMSGALGPLVGGGIATVFGAEYVIMLGMILVLTGIVPLMLPVQARMKRQRTIAPLTKADYIDKLRWAPTSVGHASEMLLSLFIWPLYIAIFLLPDDAVYSGLGFLTTLSLIASIVAAYAFGRLIDAKKGGKLFVITSLLLIVIAPVRAIISGFGALVLFNPLTEIISSGKSMPFLKGYYDTVERGGSQRLASVVSFMGIVHLTRVLLWLVLALLLLVLEDQQAFRILFVISAPLIALLPIGRFKELR